MSLPAALQAKLAKRGILKEENEEAKLELGFL